MAAISGGGRPGWPCPGRNRRKERGSQGCKLGLHGETEATLSGGIQSTEPMKSGNRATKLQAPTELDRTDRAILRQLQRDASISNVALAAKVHLSPPACLRRVERLKAQGLVRGIVALLEPRAL